MWDMADMDDFWEQRMAIYALRRQETQQLRDEHKQMKDALKRAQRYIGRIINRFEMTDDLDTIWDQVCDGLGLDASDEQDRWESMTDEEMEKAE